MSEPLKVSEKPAVSDLGFDPSDTAGAQWRNFFSYLTGRMTQQGVLNWRQHTSIQNEEKDCRRCEEQRDYLLTNSPMIRFMQDRISELGGDLNSSNIRCKRCDLTGPGSQYGGGFNADYGIMLCANLVPKKKIEDTLAHEMIHAWDHLRFRVDRNELRHSACTEIRASTLSGECRWSREFFDRFSFKYPGQFQECIRRRAVQSVRAHPSCPDDVAAVHAVNSVWDSCFNDKRPFEEIYR